jgi:general secretion pathway protein G
MSTLAVSPPERHVGAASAAPGFSLVEVLITAALIMTVAAIAVPMYFQALQRARVVRSIGDITTIALEISAFRVANNGYPASLAQLGTVHLTDPWGRPYQYLRIVGLKDRSGLRTDKHLNPINSDYDLYSFGKNGESASPLNNQKSLDDIVRATDGAFIGLAADF